MPQGSILGPILFLIYINDFNKCHNSISVQYADDKAIITSDNDINALYEKTNLELQNIFDWFCANKLSLNTAKTVFMIISNKRDIVRHNCHLQINNSPLKEVKETKFLGIVLDNKLTF